MSTFGTDTDEDVSGYYASTAVEIANELNLVLKGRPTASVYLAIGMTLAAMEAHAGRPNREQTLRLLSGVMDDYKPKL